MVYGDMLQMLLDAQAQLDNLSKRIGACIVENRVGDPPVCYGQDDCSISMLSVCPWRNDCDKGLESKQ
jgi:hypothetical protein